MSLLQPAVEIDQQVDRPPAAARSIDCEIARRDAASSGSVAQKRLQLAELPRLVGERKVFGVRLEEEIERIVDGHFGHQIDFDAELVRPSRGTSAARRSCSAGSCCQFRKWPGGVTRCE